MTPITEDQVVALMDGCAKREKTRLKTRQSAATDGKLGKGASARILRFARSADVVSIETRRDEAPKRTVSGMFYYVGGRGNAPA